MRIVFFVENNHCGGMDSFFINLINHWPDARDELTLVYNYDHRGGAVVQRAVTRPCNFVGHRIPLNWRLIGTRLGWMPAVLRLPLRYLARIALLPIQIRALRRLFRRLQGDRLLVVNGAYPGGESCRAAALAWIADGREPYVYNIRNFAAAPRRFTAWYENRLDLRVIRGAREFVGVSRCCAESLRIRSAFAKLPNIRHIYNGVPTPAATGLVTEVPDLRAMFEIRGPICLMLATYEPRKGHAFLFEAFALVKQAVPDAHLVVCGDATGGDKQRVEELRARSPVHDSIHLAGYISGGGNLINQADLLLVASQEWESFGWTVIEAMVRNVPVVSTNVGGLLEVVGPDGVAGYTVAPDDRKGFSDRVVQLLRNESERKAMGQRCGQRVAEMFDVVRMVREYADAIR